MASGAPSSGSAGSRTGKPARSEAVSASTSSPKIEAGSRRCLGARRRGRRRGDRRRGSAAGVAEDESDPRNAERHCACNRGEYDKHHDGQHERPAHRREREPAAPGGAWLPGHDAGTDTGGEVRSVRCESRLRPCHRRRQRAERPGQLVVTHRAKPVHPFSHLPARRPFRRGPRAVVRAPATSAT